VTNIIAAVLPVGVYFNNMRVMINMSHTFVGDIGINLKAPNGKILNLFHRHGGSGDNMVNTIISSQGTNALSDGNAPFTGTFRANVQMNVGPTGYKSNVTSFADLYSDPAGNWTLVLVDYVGDDDGTLTSWEIVFYTASQSPSVSPSTSSSPSVSQSPSATEITFKSGPINVDVPDNNAAGVTHKIAAVLAVGVYFNNMRVMINMSHTFVGDIGINLKSPSGKILNLFNRHGENEDNMVNTVISSQGTNALSDGNAPFTGTFRATGSLNVGPTQYKSNVTSFADLYSDPSGNWTLVLVDFAFGDVGSLTSWEIVFYTTSQSPSVSPSSSSSPSVSQSPSTSPSVSPSSSPSVSQSPSSSPSVSPSSSPSVSQSPSSSPSVSQSPSLTLTWHLAPAGQNTCDYGSPAQKKHCEAAVAALARVAGETPGRDMQVGYGDNGCYDGGWGNVPLGCSAQTSMTGGDWAAHYKTNGENCNSGLYQLVCSGVSQSPSVSPSPSSSPSVSPSSSPSVSQSPSTSHRPPL
jgi:subtilisin-like proprotein convertase family protein